MPRATFLTIRLTLSRRVPAGVDSPDGHPRTGCMARRGCPAFPGLVATCGPYGYSNVRPRRHIPRGRDRPQQLPRDPDPVGDRGGRYLVGFFASAEAINGQGRPIDLADLMIG